MRSTGSRQRCAGRSLRRRNECDRRGDGYVADVRHAGHVRDDYHGRHHRELVPLDADLVPGQRGTLQRQFKTSTNTYPAAYGAWTWGSLGSWVTEVGTVNSITNSDVFSYYGSPNSSGALTPLTFPITDTSGIVAIGVKLTLSTGGSQPEKFTVTDTIAIRGTSD